MQTALPLACFLSVIRQPGIQYENSLLQIAPVDKSKCPYVKDGNDVAFQLFTRHNPTVFQDLKVGDDEKLFASNIDFHDKTMLYFHAWMETPDDGSAVMVREAYMQRGDTNVIMVDARSLQAGPWYSTAAQNTWYIGRFAGKFIDYLVSRGLNLNNTHLVGHSLGAHVAGVAGSALKSGKVARITGLDAALPLFDNLPLQQRLDPTDAKFVDTIHTDSGIFGYKVPIGHVDFYPNAGISPQPGCELEVVLPQQMLLNKCDARTQTNGFYTYYLTGRQESTFRPNSLEYKLEKLFSFIQAVRATSSRKGGVTLDKVKANIDSLNDFKDGVIDYLYYYDEETESTDAGERQSNDKRKTENVENDFDEEYNDKTDDKEANEVINDDFGEKVDTDYKNKGKTDEKVANDNIADDFDEENYENSRQTDDKDDAIEDDFVEESYDNTKNSSKTSAKRKETANYDNTEQTNKTFIIKKEVEDQIAEESDFYTKIKTDEVYTQKDTPSNIEDTFNVKTRKKREIDPSNNNNNENIELTVVSGNLTLTKENINTTQDSNIFNVNITSEVTTEEVGEANHSKENYITTRMPLENREENNTKENEVTTQIPDIKVKPTVSASEDDFEISIDDGDKEFATTKDRNKPNPFRNLFRPRPILRQIIRIIPRINKNDFKNKRPKFSFLKNRVSVKNNRDKAKIGSKFKNNILKRQKRFLPFFQRSEDSNNILFRMLDFLIKNRKNVLPVFTVMREINTLVKSANGELNHVSKESNNYIGATPPTFTPITYSLELGNENRVMAFVKRIFGVVPKGDRLTIGAGK